MSTHFNHHQPDGESDPYLRRRIMDEEPHYISLGGPIGRVALGRDNTFLFWFTGPNQARYDHIALTYEDPFDGLDRQAVLFECPDLMQDLTRMSGYGVYLIEFAPLQTQLFYERHKMQQNGGFDATGKAL